MNNVCEVTLSLLMSEKKLCLNINWQGFAENILDSFDVSGQILGEDVGYWLMLNLKRILEQRTLPERINFTLEDVNLLKITEICKIYKEVEKVIQKNLNLFRDLKSEFKDYAANNNNYLFINIEDSKDFANIAKKTESLAKNNVKSINFSSGWNPVSREWEDNESLPSFKTLLNLIKENNASKVFSVNVYIVSHIYKSENIFVLPLLLHLGIEFISLDYDIYDLSPYGYYTKALYTHPDCRKYSVYPSLSEYFDKALNLNSVSYYNYIDTPNTEETPELINNEKLTAVITANSRLECCDQNSMATLTFLSFVNVDNLYSDYQWLYFALRHHLLLVSNLSFSLKQKLYSTLSNIYLNTMTLFKYDVISKIDKKFNVEIYGDKGWNEIFPEYYQNKYLSEEEMKSKFSSGNVVSILFNQNFSALECNPVFQRALINNCPYLTFPALQHLNSHEGLRTLEYCNATELNSKLSQLNSLLQNKELISALKNTKNDTHQCFNNFISQLSQAKTSSNSYELLIQSIRSEFNKKLDEYYLKNQTKILHCFDSLFNPNSTRNKSLSIPNIVIKPVLDRIINNVKLPK